jgi:dUTP pyrophosphatase
MQIYIKKLDDRAILPKYQTPGAAAVDLHALEGWLLEPGERHLFKSGLAFEIPPGMAGLVCSRSGLALKNGVCVINAPGVIDSDYRGDVGAALINLGKEAIWIHDGDRIAQLMFVPVPMVEFQLTDTLVSTERGTGGFGSTGS